MNTSPGPPEHHYLKFQEWRSLNKGTPKQRTAEWKKKAVCHNCVKKGHIKPYCTEPIIDNDDTNEKDNKIVENKSGKKKNLSKKKSVQFTNINNSTDEE